MILVEPLRFAHGGLDVQTLDVLPVLLQQRHEEVHGEADVLHQLLLRHVHVADRNTETQHLLHLELDGGLHVIHLLLEVIGVSDHGGELSRLVQARAQQSWNLLDEGVGAEEGVIALGQPLDLFLSLLSFLRSSADMQGSSLLVASSI